jgi:ERCC4-type nuclease
MLTIDSRVGSAYSASFDFKRHLSRIGVPVRVRRLKTADFTFYGNGPIGRVHVGIERKTVDEMITAFNDSRFLGGRTDDNSGGQLGRLLSTYDIVVLIIEGKSWPDPRSGILMIGRGEAGRTRHRHLYENYQKFLFSLMFKARVFILPTRSKMETVQCIHALYGWFQKKWSAHRSVYRIDETKPDSAILDVQTLCRRIAAQLPNVYWERSKKVDQYFDSIREMINADVQAWCAALGIAKGKKIAREIVRVLRETKRQRETRLHHAATLHRHRRHPWHHA